MHGAEAATRALEATLEEVGPTEMEPVATRGKHLVLARARSVSASGFEVVENGIIETNEAEQVRAMVFFDESNLDGAFRELDARYFAGEGAAHREMLLTGGKLMMASARGDFDTVRELLAPDFVVVDHQLLGFGQGDRDDYIAGSRSRDSSRRGRNVADAFTGSRRPRRADQSAPDIHHAGRQ